MGYHVVCWKWMFLIFCFGCLWKEFKIICIWYFLGLDMLFFDIFAVAPSCVSLALDPRSWSFRVPNFVPRSGIFSSDIAASAQFWCVRHFFWSPNGKTMYPTCDLMRLGATWCHHETHESWIFVEICVWSVSASWRVNPWTSQLHCIFLLGSLALSCCIQPILMSSVSSPKNEPPSKY